ncbi:hypothetical protein [Rubellicoccus peritrichatus]|uniref:Uncharacterized protein n=1 Tax=Rubellicoccus peritrichatus TaxID=3080537 RepID=A0AAQ3LED8_9BACT|nr:hypothetical protein [Puniceicoccus sp. CR14]WOO42370.1 hypothetical protein RZN69_04660 [Puniceicoccus sp. CR14]
MKSHRFFTTLLIALIAATNCKLFSSTTTDYFYCNFYQVGDSLFMFAYGSINTNALEDDSTNYEKSADPSVYFGKNHFKLWFNNDDKVKKLERYKSKDVKNLDLPADSTTITFDSDSTYYTGEQYLYFDFHTGNFDKVIMYLKESYDDGDPIAFVTKTEDFSIDDCGLSTDSNGDYESSTYHWKATGGGDTDEQYFTFNAQDLGTSNSSGYDTMIDLVEEYFGDSDDWTTIQTMFSDAFSD